MSCLLVFFHNNTVVLDILSKGIRILPKFFYAVKNKHLSLKTGNVGNGTMEIMEMVRATERKGICKNDKKHLSSQKDHIEKQHLLIQGALFKMR